ncbi:MAG: acyl-CoA transferase, partial [Pseudomonadota bacterium]
LDHATGYLMAAAVLSALADATAGDSIMFGHLSLARTAELLAILGKSEIDQDEIRSMDTDYHPDHETSGWGPGHRLKPALSVGDTEMRWDLPAPKLGTSDAIWT